VAYGTSGTAVTAVPNSGYHFVNWSDASTANPRTDGGVTNNLTVTVNFAINTYTLTYSAGANGTISGVSPQTVNYGANGTEITAVQNAGYAFTNWSDGSVANPRTDAGVTNNVSVTANFVATPPAIVLTSPTNSASFMSPAIITLAATVTTNGNTISQVQFYSNGTILVGTAVAEPYVFVWTNSVVGNHSLTATATYNATNTADSAATIISVFAPVPPLICGPFTLNGSLFSFAFSGTNGQPYRILCTTNLALPMANWIKLSGGTFSTGTVSYTDTSATNEARVYRIVSP
jgi:hypothetical protein